MLWLKLWKLKRQLKREKKDRVVKELVKIGPTVVKFLLVALKDSDKDVRQVAAEALRKIGDERAVEPLIIALKDSDEDVRKSAAEALGDIGDKRAVEPLISALDYSSAYFHASEALVKLGEVTVEPLIAALKDSDRGLRYQAASALGKIGNERAVEPLIAALNDSDEVMRQAAAKALGDIGDKRAVEPLIANLKDSKFYFYAVAALRKIGDKRAIEPLIANLEASSSLVIRESAAEALGEIGDERAIGSLIAALNNDDTFHTKNLRHVAGEALVKLGEVAVEQLIAALKDSHKSIRRGAAEVLGKIGNERAIEPLVAALNNDDYYMLQVVAKALDAFKYEPTDGTQRAKMFVAKRQWDEAVRLGIVAIDPLIAALKDSSVSEEAASALGKIGNERAVEPLIAALKEHYHDERSRGAAAKALGKIGDERAVEPLIIALKDSLYYVRLVATEALGEIGEKRAVEPLIAKLKDSDNGLRCEAASALGKIGDERAIEPLTAAYRKSNYSDREALIKALGKLGAHLD